MAPVSLNTLMGTAFLSSVNETSPSDGNGDGYYLAYSLALFGYPVNRLNQTPLQYGQVYQASSSVITNIQPGHGLYDDNSYILVKPYIK